MRRLRRYFLVLCVLGGCGEPASEVRAPGDAGSATDDAAALGCTSQPDLGVFAADPDLDLDAVTRGCVMPLVMAGGGPGSSGFVAGVAECLSQETGLSVSCTACYAQSAECSFKDCGVICLPDPKAQACRDCRCGRDGGTNCLAELAECTGAPTDACD